MARLRSLFGPAFEAARRVLRELESEQLPNDLKPVVAAAGDLPPHLERALMKALDRYEWLREKAAEAWPDADPQADGAVGASALLILRPPGWSAAIVAAAARGAADEMVRHVEQIEAERDAALARRDEAKRRHKKAEDERARLEREHAARRDGARDSRRSDEEAVARARREGEEKAERLRAEIESLQKEAEAVRSRERSLREEVRSLRRERAELAQRLDAGGTNSWAEDAVELARRIDELALMAAPSAASVATSPDGEDAPAELPPVPAGIRPDRGEAIVWLLGVAAPATVLVDGYNVGNPLADDPASMRSAVEVKAEALARAGPHRVVVIYDSAEGPDEGEFPVGAGQKVEVRFTPPGVIADDVIVDLAAASRGPVVVITSDRGLWARLEPYGVITLMSEALREWSGR